MRVLLVILLATLSVSAQSKYNITDYFPINNDDVWEYRTSSNHFDTAVLNTNVPFNGNNTICLKNSDQEIQYFKCDSTGLYIVGQTNEIGTFFFLNPIGLASTTVSIGDYIETNWSVSPVAVYFPLNWGNTIARVEAHTDSIWIQGKKYSDVLQIGIYLYGKEPIYYYLAKGIGIVQSFAYRSVKLQRELLNYCTSTTIVRYPFQNKESKHGIANGSISIPNSTGPVSLKVYTITGKLITSRTIFTSNVIDFKSLKLSTGTYFAKINSENYKFGMKISIVQ